MVRQYGNILVVVIAVIALVLAPAMYITGASTVNSIKPRPDIIEDFTFTNCAKW